MTVRTVKGESSEHSAGQNSSSNEQSVREKAPRARRAIEKARRSGPSLHSRLGGIACRSVVAHGLEVVCGCEVRDVCSELPALHVRVAEVEARPDARQDELVERLREVNSLWVMSP